MIEIWFLIPFVILLIGEANALRYAFRAMRNLSPLGREKPWYVWFLGGMAGPQYFTREGVRYRFLAIAWGVGTFVLSFVLLAAVGAVSGG